MGPQIAAPMNTAARAIPEFTSIVRLLILGVNRYVSICWYTVANRMIHSAFSGWVKTTKSSGTAMPMYVPTTGMNCAVMPTSSASGSQYGTPIAQKNTPWNIDESAARTTLDTT
jgi:hypothetical protein